MPAARPTSATPRRAYPFAFKPGLGGGPVYCPHSQVIGPPPTRLGEQQPGSLSSTRVGSPAARFVAPPGRGGRRGEVGPVGPRGHGDVHPVVDDQYGPSLPRYREKFAGLPPQIFGRGPLVAQLDCVSAGGNTLGDYIDKRPAAGGVRCGNDHEPKALEAFGVGVPSHPPGRAARARATARLCSASVRENSWEPSTCAMK